MRHILPTRRKFTCLRCCSAQPFQVATVRTFVGSVSPSPTDLNSEILEKFMIVSSYLFETRQQPSTSCCSRVIDWPSYPNLAASKSVSRPRISNHWTTSEVICSLIQRTLRPPLVIQAFWRNTRTQRHLSGPPGHSYCLKF